MTRAKPKKAAKHATRKRKRLIGAAKLTPKRSIEIEEVRRDVVRLRSLGLKLQEVADKLGIPVGTVWNHEKAAVKRATALTDAETVAFKLDQVEKLLAQADELARAWEASKEATGGIGDPRFLDARTRTLARLHALNGLDAAIKSELDLKGDRLALTVVTKKSEPSGPDSRTA